jgi:hypothetical protein
MQPDIRRKFSRFILPREEPSPSSSSWISLRFLGQAEQHAACRSTGGTGRAAAGAGQSSQISARHAGGGRDCDLGRRGTGTALQRKKRR